MFNPPPFEHKGSSRPSSGKHKLPWPTSLLKEGLIEEHKEEKKEELKEEIKEAPKTQTPSNPNKQLYVWRNRRLKYKDGVSGGIIIPMEIETSDLKKRM